MDLNQKFLSFFKENNLQNDAHFLVAVSGGIDSVVLCHLCHAAGLQFSMAHCNFGLRGEESKRDEAFVTSMAERYQAPFFLTHFNTKAIAEENKISIQEAARKLRYDWFNDILTGKVSPLSTNTPFPIPLYLFTAHHLDDNIETVLMNFFKGTGINGLKGIRPVNDKIVRPLIFAKRSEIEAYAQANELSWVHDSSNDDSKYTRNYFRHQVIPLVEKVFPEAINNVAQNIQRFSEAEILYQQAIEAHKKKLLEQKGEEIHIPVLKLLKCRPQATILYEIVKDYGFSHKQVSDIVHLLNSDTGKYINSATHRILRNRNWLIISPLKTEEARIILIEEGQNKVEFDKHSLSISQLKNETGIAINEDKNIAILDAGAIEYPLLLRKWKQGDYFYPLGMRKKKKLARFFIDQKLSKIEKENIWVIESAKKIIWVVGQRIDDRFKITDATEKGVRFQVL